MRIPLPRKLVTGPARLERSQAAGAVDGCRYGRFDEQYPAVKGCRRAEVLGALACCRQGELGAKQHRCGDCGNEHVTLNACGNRHCPNCARQSRYLWHRDVLNWSLNCDYLHIVCTLPHEPNDLIATNQSQLLRLLFRCTRETLLEFIQKRYGCKPGLILVLHTWGQRLNYHFHVHAVMTAGGLSTDQQWIEIDQDEVEAAAAEIARRFKAKYIRGLRKLLRSKKLDMPPSLASEASLKKMLSTIERKDWIANVGATPQKYRDSGDRRMSLGYVGKYVAGTAIGDGRIIEDAGGKITFRAFDYRTRESIELTMHDREFVDAFSQHILPLRLRRFRMAGIFAPQGREARLAVCRTHLGEMTDQQFADLADETNPHDRFEGDEEEEGSYVPCPVCDQRMQLRFVVEANLICPLLEVAAIAMALLQAGAVASIRQAILKVARAGRSHCPVRRALVPGSFGANEDMLRTAEALVEARLREEAEAVSPVPRAPPETAA